MTCASCGTRKAKRACPALGRSICPTCCGTKRLKEIACLPTCTYLGNAQAHPPAVVQRQRERDMPMLVQMIEKLTAQQGEALSVLQARIRMHRAAAIPALRDSDVEDAMKALASTLETAARGILYEHQAVSVPAMRLQQDLRAVLAELGERERALGPGVMAPVLRRIETMVQRARRHFAAPPAGQAGPGHPGSGHAGSGHDATAGTAEDTAFLDFLDRIGRPLPRESGEIEHGSIVEADRMPPSPSRIILP
jgi:hypothetical protein